MRLISIFLLSLTSISCLTPNDEYLKNLTDIADSSNTDTIAPTPEPPSPLSKSEGLPFHKRIECPEPSEDNKNNLIIIKHDEKYGTNYALEWDCQKRAQRWAAFQMYAGNTGYNVRRSGDDAWHEDDNIPTQYRTSYQDHYQNGYDRGHIVASADRLVSRAMNKATFCYSNVHPQLNELNSGPWMKMEEKVRSWNNDEFRDTLYIVKGATIDNSQQILGYTTSGLIIPKYFFMAVICLKDGKYKGMAFWIDHRKKYTKDDYDLKNHTFSISQLETFTGLNLFYNLPMSEQIKIKSETVLKDWQL